jgi:hypothetical protein
MINRRKFLFNTALTTAGALVSSTFTEAHPHQKSLSEQAEEASIAKPLILWPR